MTRKSQKGFTLIELLVVIAIIGISLSAIVLASLGTARSKGNDAKTLAQISQIRAAAEIFASNAGGTYAGLCTAPSTDTSGVYNLIEVAGNYNPSGAAGCKVSTAGDAWVAAHPLSNGTTYACSDSSGVSTTSTTVLSQTALTALLDADVHCQ